MKPFLTGVAELVGIYAIFAVLFLWFIVMGA